MSCSKRNKIQNRDPIIQEAKKLGFIVTAGSKHWMVRHPLGGCFILGFNGQQKRTKLYDMRARKNLYRILDSHKATNEIPK